MYWRGADYMVCDACARHEFRDDPEETTTVSLASSAEECLRRLQDARNTSDSDESSLWEERLEAAIAESMPIQPCIDEQPWPDQSSRWHHIRQAARAPRHRRWTPPRPRPRPQTPQASFKPGTLSYPTPLDILHANSYPLNAEDQTRAFILKASAVAEFGVTDVFDSFDSVFKIVIKNLGVENPVLALPLDLFKDLYAEALKVVEDITRLQGGRFEIIREDCFFVRLTTRTRQSTEGYLRAVYIGEENETALVFPRRQHPSDHRL